MLKGETIASGAPYKCEDCGVVLELQLLMSNAGHYIGTQCNCGPYSRESHYYKNRDEANKALKNWNVEWR
jgi:hypothetical protein